MGLKDSHTFLGIALYQQNEQLEQGSAPDQSRRRNFASLAALSSFELAAEVVLKYLQSKYGMKLWMTSRLIGEKLVVLQAVDEYYSIEKGAALEWSESLCAKMVEGKGPQVAPRANDVAWYKDCPNAKKMKIGAYLGVPIRLRDGTFFGTLCAIDPEPQSDELANHLEEITLMTQLLATVLEKEMSSAEQRGVLEHSISDALIDSQTGLMNGSGWQRRILVEEIYAKQFGSPLSVAVLDLDDLKQINAALGTDEGDRLIQVTAECLKEYVRAGDILARIGGDEFAVLAVECDEAGSERLARILQIALEREGVQASLGVATLLPGSNLQETTAAAGKDMYRNKCQRRRAMCERFDAVQSSDFMPVSR